MTWDWVDRVDWGLLYHPPPPPPPPPPPRFTRGGGGYNVNARLQGRWAISPGHTNGWLYPYRPVAVLAPGAFGGGVAPVAGTGTGICHNPYINRC